ncbi:XrtA/PEP-CTERM system histidine kinase PrsK [Sphingomonas sp. 1P06PA]|uniref:XrtA/PEP-CTERM system histidine kinase PrsK n=1 Tax=Sphingomonas sp. 1P06PA TaxID=554121 RepID=UPI0039A552D1
MIGPDLSILSTACHALAALLFAALSAWQAIRGRALAQRWLPAAAFALTALWALAIAVAGPWTLLAQQAELARNLGWLGTLLALLARAQGGPRSRAVVALHGAVGTVFVSQSVVALLVSWQIGTARITDAMLVVTAPLAMMGMVGALLLVHNLYTAATPAARAAIRPALLGLAMLWAYDLNLATLAWIDGVSALLTALRGVIAVAVTPLFLVAITREAGWRIELSRKAAFGSLGVLAASAYLLAMLAAAVLMQRAGGDYRQLGWISLAGATALAAGILIVPARWRAWVRVTASKHLFSHRYDYRLEWLRFSETLGLPGSDPAPLDERVVQAIAQITESPGGLLLQPDGGGGLVAGAHWNWPDPAPAACADGEFAAMLETDGRIVALDEARAGIGHAPRWMLTSLRAWAVVPLIHQGRLVGAVLLARPALSRGLDWEDFDLLRAAGRQAASSLAEARGQEALSDARRFDEFNRRFAFIMHDIKNLVSQLSLVARNAERHADNPAFRADMIETLRESVGKMNDLLARLSTQAKAPVGEARPIPLGAIAEAVVAPRRGVAMLAIDGRGDVRAMADPGRLESALGHLVQNAIEASPSGSPILVRIARRDAAAAIDVIDQGCGMSAEFIRTRLFRPFASTKDNGFGVGAFEARALVAAMGGRLEVESREGEGSRFTIILPLADTAADWSAGPPTRKVA